MSNNNLNPLYKVEIYNSSGTLVADLSGKYVNSIRLDLIRNRAEQITLNFNLQHLEAYARTLNTDVLALLQVCLNEIRIKRGDNYLCAGQINHIQASASGDVMGLEVRASGWLELFSKRFTDASEVYSSTDAGSIAWDLINDTQTISTFGVTQGTIQTSVTRDRTYEYKNIKDAIIQLSEVINGFDFEFTYDKIFNVYYPRQGSSTPIEFEYGRNCAAISLPIDGTFICNEAIVRGQGFGTEQLLQTRTSASSQTTYKVRTKILDFPDVKETSTLQQKGDAELLVNSIPTFTPQIVLMPNQDSTQPVIQRDFWLDDSYTVKVPGSDFFSIAANNVYRIESINISVNQDGVETISINEGDKAIGAAADIPQAPPAPAALKMSKSSGDMLGRPKVSGKKRTSRPKLGGPASLLPYKPKLGTPGSTSPI